MTPRPQRTQPREPIQVPPPIASLLSQVSAIESQLNALKHAIESLSMGMIAAAATRMMREQHESGPLRADRFPVFGSATPDPASDTISRLRSHAKTADDVLRAAFPKQKRRRSTRK